MPLAGTILPDGTILSGDDAPDWRALGHRVEAVHVLCSAKVATGEQSPPAGPVRVAIDCNGQPVDRVAKIIGVDCVPVTGAYAGERTPAALATVDATVVNTLHGKLSDQLPGFGCFAVLA